MFRSAAAAAVLVLVVQGCSFTTKVFDLHDLKAVDGRDLAYLSTTNYALNFLFFLRLIGNASLEGTISDLTHEALTVGAESIRITQDSSTTYWFILPPLSFIIHPVVTTVSGDAISRAIIQEED